MSLVESRTDGRVRVLTLTRPEARNALNAQMRKDLMAELQAAEAEAGVGAIVLTGAGTVFAAGADLQELSERTSDAQRAFLQPPHIYSVVENLRKPVLAAINGHALGAGLELATACDLRICAEHAKLGAPEIGLALIPGGGGTQRLVRLVGRGPASRLVFTGEAITAQEALRIGLVDAVHPDDRVLGESIKLAQNMARQDPAAIACAKRSLHAATEKAYAEGLAFEVEEFVRLHAGAESRKRIQAFLDKPR